MNDLTDKLRTGKSLSVKSYVTICAECNTDQERPSSVDHPDYAVDNIIMRCVDDVPSDDRADSISSHHQVIGRRCPYRIATTNASTIATNVCKWYSHTKLCV